MQALRFHGARDLRLEKVPDPPAPSGTQVLIAPQVCGICGSDVHEYTEGPLRTTVAPHPLTGGRIPQILGHEFSALVLATGPEVTSVAEGDHVSIMPLIGCGRCAACRSGHEQLCDLRASVGMRHPYGGLAELGVVDESQAVPMPAGMSFEQGALIEPTAVSWSAVRAAHVRPGQRVLVTGAGPIGALAALAAAAAGAEVLVSEPDPGRAFWIAEQGFKTIDPTRDDVIEACRDSVGDGVDAVIECAGHEDAMRTALYAVRPGGYIVEAGLPTRPVTLPIVTLTLRGLTLIGSVCYSLRCWPEVIDEIVSGRLPAERIVSGHVDLAHAVEDGFERLLDPAQDAVKVLVGVGSA